jgi:hypothetical protein
MFHKINFKQFTINPIESAQKRLKFHQEKGENTTLSIFEVAYLMDQIVFSPNDEQNNNQTNSFEFCIN